MGQRQTGRYASEETSGPENDAATIRVYFSDSRYCEIDKETSTSCTVGLFLSEAIRHLRARFGENVIDQRFAYQHIVGLRMRHGTEMADFWLTQYDRPMPSIHYTDQMELIYSDYVQQRRVPQLSDFQLIKVIGKGGFSRVLQVRKKDTGALYAMKVISKAFVMQKGKAEQIMVERRVMSRISHPFIVKLHYAFQSKHYLFLILDFCPGGELFYLLHNRVRFSEETARFYFAEVLLAVEYIHAQKIVYRDLKPENILLDIDGNLKLTDFGLARENFDSCARSYSFCGSPEYMSPEMLTRDGHGFSLDCYSLGALLFEMLTGLPPHYSKNRQQMYQRILNDPAIYPLYLSQSAVDLLELLLHKDPQQRPTATEIRRHPFLAGIRWDDLYNRRIDPPHRPDMRESHFDPEYTSMRITWSEGDDTHEGNPVRSQSLTETLAMPEECEDSFGVEKNETYRPSAGEASSKARCGPNNNSGPKRGLSKNATKSRANLAKDYYCSKSSLELFLGYAFSCDIVLPSKNSRPTPAPPLHPPSPSSATKNSLSACKKPVSIQAASLRGESNDPDANLSPDIVEQPAKMHPLLFSQYQKRCASVGKQTRLGPKDMKKYVFKANLKRPAMVEALSPVVAARNGTASGFSQKLAQYETFTLIKCKRSKVTAGIIKLNDELHGVVSERKREANLRPPLSPTKTKTSLNLATTSPKKSSSPSRQPDKPPVLTRHSTTKGLNLSLVPAAASLASGWTVDPIDPANCATSLLESPPASRKIVNAFQRSHPPKEKPKIMRRSTFGSSDKPARTAPKIVSPPNILLNKGKPAEKRIPQNHPRPKTRMLVPASANRTRSHTKPVRPSMTRNCSVLGSRLLQQKKEVRGDKGDEEIRIPKFSIVHEGMTSSVKGSPPTLKLRLCYKTKGMPELDGEIDENVKKCMMPPESPPVKRAYMLLHH